MTKEVTLVVNEQPIETDYFVESFIDHTVRGMLGSLEGVGDIKSAEVAIDGKRTSIRVNGEALPANPFVQKITASVVTSMAACLKGVTDTGKIKVTLVKK